MEFRLELLVDSPSKIEESREEVRKRAYQFKANYLVKHPNYSSDKKLNENLFWELENGRFWGTLSDLDGLPDDLNRPWPSFEKFDTEADRRKARSWALQKFSHDELQEMLTIVINQALLVPYEGGWPGLYRGHSILYRDIVKKEGSIFRSAIDRDFLKRLNNGRLWENIPDMYFSVNYGMHYVEVDDVLINHFDDVDVDFAPKGFKILNRHIERCISEPTFNLDHISNEAIDNYFIFLKKLHDNIQHLDSSIDSKRALEHLVRAYIILVIDINDGPKFPLDGNKGRSFKVRLQEDPIPEYLKKSKIVRNALYNGQYQGLKFMCEWENYHTHAVDVMSSLPNPEEAFLGIINKIRDSSKKNLFHLARKKRILSSILL